MKKPVVLLVLLPQLWIFQGGGWNQNSRFALARALVVRGSVRIDPDAGATGDVAVRGGHTYCDKAPGVSFLAAAALAVVGPLGAAAGLDPSRPWWWRAIPYLVTLLSISLPVALAAGVLHEELAAMFGAPAALLSIAAVFLGTPLLGYAGLLYGHALAGAAIALGWVGLRRRRWALSGLACGAAVAIEYTAALGAAAIFVLLLSHEGPAPAGAGRLSPWRDADLRRRALAFAAAALPPLLLVAAYNAAAFGAPWSIGYAHLPREQFEGMGTGIFGVHLPRPGALWQLSFGEHRGLFRMAPALLLAFPAARFLPRREALLSLGLFAAFLCVNAGYVYWDGHASFGPRHAVPGLVLLCLPMAAAAKRWPRATLALTLVSIVLCGLAWSTRPEAAPQDWNPFTESWLRFWRKDAIASSIFWFNFKEPLDFRSGFSLPMLLGLDGRASLLPLLPIALGLLAWWKRAGARA